MTTNAELLKAIKELSEKIDRLHPVPFHPTAPSGWTCGRCWAWVNAGSLHFCHGGTTGLPFTQPWITSTGGHTTATLGGGTLSGQTGGQINVTPFNSAE